MNEIKKEPQLMEEVESLDVLEQHLEKMKSSYKKLEFIAPIIVSVLVSIIVPLLFWGIMALSNNK